MTRLSAAEPKAIDPPRYRIFVLVARTRQWRFRKNVRRALTARIDDGRVTTFSIQEMTQ